MKIIRVEITNRGYEFHLNGYLEYLKKIETDLPRETYEFAAAPWHYDFRDPKCPHDSWIDSINIKETDMDGTRVATLHILSIGAYTNGRFLIEYQDLKRYTLNFDCNNIIANSSPHGDWLIDEISLSEEKEVVHEIQFQFGSILIVCARVKYEWTASTD